MTVYTRFTSLVKPASLQIASELIVFHINLYEMTCIGLELSLSNLKSESLA